MSSESFGNRGQEKIVGTNNVKVRNPTVVPMLNRSGQGKHSPKRIKYKTGIDNVDEM